MSLLDKLVKYKTTDQSIPSVSGIAYDKTLNMGSWVISGVAEYKRWSYHNFARLRRYLDRYFNFERDPQKALWLLNTLTRQNPVKIPEYMSSDEWAGLQKYWNEWILAREQVLPKEPWTHREYDYAIKVPDDTNPSAKSPIEENPESFKSPIFNKGGFFSFKLPTGELIKGKSPQEVVSEVFSKLGITSGTSSYGILSGFEPGSDHNWNLSLKPYKPDGGTTYTPDLPEYDLTNIYALADPNKSKTYRFSFGTNCPCMQYNIQFGNQGSKEINLFNSSSFQIPLGFNYNINLGIDILDDVHGSMRMYMNKYLNSIYDLSEGSAARYDQAAFQIDLNVFKDGYFPKYQFSFIGVPINYTPVYDGQATPNEESVHIDFSIVGLIVPPSTSKIKDAMWGNSNWDSKKTSGEKTDDSWTTVILNPGK